MKKTYLLLLTLVITSCIPEESPVTPKDRGDLTTGYMQKSIYDYQGFFDLSSNQFITYNHKPSWDIALDCSENYIILNGGRPVRAAMIESSDFIEANELLMPDSVYIDEPTGEWDKSALGRWWIDDAGNQTQQSKIFYIDRGRDERRRPLGIFKFQVTNWDNESYTIQFGDIKKQQIYQMKVKRNPDYNFVYVNFSDTTKLQQVEPQKNQWDLLFTENSEYVPLDAIGVSQETDAIPYQVRGVYLNPSSVEAILYTNPDSLDFKDIKREDIQLLTLSKNLNAIGYDWKAFSLQGDAYTVYSNKYYIIKNRFGLLYKLRFISYFSKEGGERGFTTFEYQQL